MSIQSSNLSFSYNSKVSFRFPDINLQSGESTLVLGRSGVGKTTLLHLLGGLLEPASGEIHINGVKFSNIPAKTKDKLRGKHIGIVFQKNYFLPYLSIEQNLKAAASIQATSITNTEIKTVLEELNITHTLKKQPSECSIGEQQRASIARVMLQRPSVILADEPSSALDDLNAKKVSEILKNVAESNQSSLIIVTHDSRLKNNFSKTFEL